MHSPSTHKRWRPSPLISASLALHLGAMLATVARPRLWPWTLGALVADHLLLTAAGLWPGSKLLGPNWAHLPAAAAARGAGAITIDDGPEPEVTARGLAPLGGDGGKAGFLCSGERSQPRSERPAG